MENQEFQKTVIEELKSINKRFDTVDKRFDGVDKRLDVVDKRLDGIDKRLNVVDKRLDNLEKDNTLIQSQVSENTQMLKALIHVSEVNKAYQDRMEITLARIEGKVTANSSDIVQLKAIKK
ncbi:MAG: hypothetical protein A2Y25_05215 [Candidatus Melainabacteria bacterium GWF2_37_15]|nr:MAG: hypothetical protein A2Y25_05215 [Candidatus Melainabacteria bacterium GWF2_37_15]